MIYTALILFLCNDDQYNAIVRQWEPKVYV